MLDLLSQSNVDLLSLISLLNNFSCKMEFSPSEEAVKYVSITNASVHHTSKRNVIFKSWDSAKDFSNGWMPS